LEIITVASPPAIGLNSCNLTINSSNEYILFFLN